MCPTNAKQDTDGYGFIFHLVFPFLCPTNSEQDTDGYGFIFHLVFLFLCPTNAEDDLVLMDMAAKSTLVVKMDIGSRVTVGPNDLEGLFQP